MKCKLIGTGLAALALLASTFSTEAADIPRPVYKGVRPVVAYYNWTGFYGGIVAGYGWGDSDWSAPAVSLSPNGWMIGGTLGYNYQVGSIVWGIEADGSWSNVRDSVACGAFTCETRNNWLATIRGRVGYAFDRWLPYITGGGAAGEVEARNSNPAVANATETQFGWTVGAGLEYAFLGNWSAKIEYLYVDLGDFNALPAPAVNTVTFKENIVRAGLNYKFSGPIFSRF